VIAETISRLRVNKEALGLKLIGGAAAFQQAAEKNPAATPGAFVYLLADEPQPRRFTGADAQRVDLSMAVVLVVRNVADATGEAASADIDALRAVIKPLLSAWVPADGYAPLERGAGNLLAFRDGHLWWQDSYRTYLFEGSL
jgi:hypothetical protein